MQFSTILAILVASMATATPIAQPEAAVVEATSSQPLVDVWVDKEFLGLKFTGKADVGECKNFPGDFTDDISSGKAKPGFRCTVWVEKDCEGTGFSFNENPGVSALPGWINDKSKSWKCVKA